MDYSTKYFTPASKRQLLIIKMAAPFTRWLKKRAFIVDVVQSVRPDTDMITVEQRLNMFHLVNEMLVHNVEGELAEMGSHLGITTMQIQDIVTRSGSPKKFHVYDIFSHSAYGADANIKERFLRNFADAGIPVPILHEGYFKDTIPSQLPDKLCFVHIDCGFGGDRNEHKDNMLMLFENIYPRMSKGAICLLMDYHDPSRVIGGHDGNPGTKVACDMFLADKPEKVFQLYGNQFSHGYFRKL